MKSIITPPLLLLCGLMTMAAAAPPAVSIEPHPHNPPDQNQYLAFMAKAPWLDGYIRVRFPENINSKLGLHFLDNLQPELPRVSKVALPEWQTDPGTGALFYQVKTAEGIGFAGRVRVEGEVIHMEYTVTNGTKEVQDLTSQVCFDMAPAKGLNERITLDHTFTWIGGEYRSLATTTSARPSWPKTDSTGCSCSTTSKRTTRCEKSRTNVSGGSSIKSPICRLWSGKPPTANTSWQSLGKGPPLGG